MIEPAKRAPLPECLVGMHPLRQGASGLPSLIDVFQSPNSRRLLSQTSHRSIPAALLRHLTSDWRAQRRETRSCFPGSIPDCG